MGNEMVVGDWTLKVSGQGSNVRLVLTGTDGIDGRDLPGSEPFVLEATGTEWRMSGEMLWPHSDFWDALAPRISSFWDAGPGSPGSSSGSLEFATRRPRPGIDAARPYEPGDRRLLESRPRLTGGSHPYPPDFSVPGGDSGARAI